MFKNTFFNKTSSNGNKRLTTMYTRSNDTTCNWDDEKANMTEGTDKPKKG